MEFLIATAVLVLMAVMVTFCYAALVVAGRADKLEDDLLEQYLKELDDDENSD